MALLTEEGIPYFTQVPTVHTGLPIFGVPAFYDPPIIHAGDTTTSLGLMPPIFKPYRGGIPKIYDHDLEEWVVVPSGP